MCCVHSTSLNLVENFITVMTPAVYDYQYLPEVPVSNKATVAFRLKAKSNAHVALSSVYGDTERKTYGRSDEKMSSGR